MSTAIAQLRETGGLELTEKAWFESKLSLMSREAPNEPNALNVKTFGGLFLISGISLLTALFLFLIYTLREKWHTRFESTLDDRV